MTDLKPCVDESGERLAVDGESPHLAFVDFVRRLMEQRQRQTARECGTGRLARRSQSLTGSTHRSSGVAAIALMGPGVQWCVSTHTRGRALQIRVVTRS
jgi:hypothetical protein